MQLKKLLGSLKYELISGDLNKTINEIAYDSRKVGKDTLFVCIKGDKFDGHKFAKEAFEKGATVLLVEEDMDLINSGVTVIKVKNTKKALASVSNVFYGKPSESLNVIGITGTNGKTSVSYLVSEILNYSGRSTGVIGTVGIKLNGEELDLEKNTPTTPNSLELQEIIKVMLDKKATDVIMEVTSISLEQYRVEDCEIEIGIFTNLTEDHLDFHGNMSNYKEAKKKLFYKCKKGIINVDDKCGREFVNTMFDQQKKVLTYGIDNEADLKASNIVISSTGNKFDLEYDGESYGVETNLTGKFNIYNTLAAIGAAIQLGVPTLDILAAFKDIYGAKGRFESLESSKGYSVIVDYAHTPDALENVLETIKEFKPSKLISVFGAGGDRDRTKRPLMGKISGELSNLTIVTSDNPRTEDPLSIIKDIENGLKITSGNYEIEPDRERAIIKALDIAEENDVVLIAGKGHENYQIVGDKIIDFDDLEIVKKHLF